MWKKERNDDFVSFTSKDGHEQVNRYHREKKGSRVRWQYIVNFSGVDTLFGHGATAKEAKADCEKRFLRMMAKTHDILAIFDK